MIKIEKALPGEYDGTVNPEDYGFDVIREAPLSEQEETERVRRLYARTKALTGVVIPSLEPYLEAEPSAEPSGAVREGEPSREGGDTTT